VSYLHKTSPDLPAQIGVLFGHEGGDEAIGRDVAMHIAAFSPTVLTREDRSPPTVENERKVAEATAREEGKPEAALPKIIEGRVNGFFKENVLLEQAFAKDQKKSVAQVLKEAGAPRGVILRPLPRRQLIASAQTPAPSGMPPAPVRGPGGIPR
jgi:elongation factor Ts